MIVSHKADASYGHLCARYLACSDNVTQQMLLASSPPLGTNATESTAEGKADKLAQSISEYNERVAKLRQANHRWNIFFVATGVSMTLLSTSLGAVGSALSEKAKPRTTITIAVLGAVAAASQTIATKIPVAKRAGEYATIQSALVALEYKALDATTNEELDSLQGQFYELIEKTGQAEAAE